MVKIGFIGTGSMGEMLIRKFTETGTVAASDIIASNRSIDKLESLSRKTCIRAAKDNRDVVKRSDVIFLCVKPIDARGVLKEAWDILTPEKLLVSIVSDVTINDIRSLCGARVIRVVPSITAECSKGISLVSFGANATKADRGLVLSLLAAIGKPVEADEKDFELLADLTSCAPAFIAAMMQEMALSAARKGISQDQAELLVRETLAGTAELLSRDGRGFDELVGRVATKGGITEEGVNVIKNEIPAMYDDILKVTLAKHQLVKDKLRGQ